MDKTDELKRAFLESLDGAFAIPGTPLEKLDPVELYLGQLVLYELATNEHLYDQPRYDALYLGLNRVLGWTRVQLHQNLLEYKSLQRSCPTGISAVREGLSKSSKVLLAKIIDELFLSEINNPDFRVYLSNKLKGLLI